jgi:hypothetical protein
VYTHTLVDNGIIYDICAIYFLCVLYNYVQIPDWAWPRIAAMRAAGPVARMMAGETPLTMFNLLNTLQLLTSSSSMYELELCLVTILHTVPEVVDDHPYSSIALH